MNLEQFLEEEINDFEDSFEIDGQGYAPQSQVRWIKDHDTRLINFVLEKLEKEIGETISRCPRCEKLGINVYGECICSYEDKDFLKKKDVLSIINQIRNEVMRQ